MRGSVERRYCERWLRVDVWDARCGETIRIDAEESAEMRVLRLETRDLVLAHLGPVQVLLGVCCLRVCSGGGIWTFRWVPGGRGSGGGGGGGSGGILGGGGGGGDGDDRNSCTIVRKRGFRRRKLCLRFVFDWRRMAGWDIVLRRIGKFRL
jgi:hypothetical protein